MNRRNFLRSLVGGVATAAAVRSWPFRVYSFPTAPAIEFDKRIFWFGCDPPAELAFYLNADQKKAWDELVGDKLPALYGIRYIEDVENAGTKWLGLKRSPYPGALNSAE